MRNRFARLVTYLVIGALVMATTALPAAAETSGLIPESPIAEVAAAAKPSVVGILTTLKAERSTEKGRAAGTGFVYKDGVILTNAHVVDGAVEVRVLYDGGKVEVVSPTQIFSDPVSDVAVIKVKEQGLKPLPLGNSDEVTVGQYVVAVGNPLGFRLGNSVTAGILSGKGRALGSGYPFLQTDAPINPGNSGGPLFNLSGEVIGINSAKMADIGVEGLGFAIPINTAVEIAEKLLRDGKVERAVLGLMLDEGWEAYFGVPNTEGVTIAGVIQDGPAGLTALRPGDKLVRLDDTPIYTTDDVFAFLTRHEPGDWVTVTVRRGGQLLSVRIQLASQSELRRVAEEQGIEEGGILIGLTAGQIQEAAEFGRQMSWGWGDVNQDYFAVSGSDFAILYTEYLYVARRIASAYDFGFTPGVGFQQAVANEIKHKVEVQMEIIGDQPDFLNGASFTLEQEGIKQVLGAVEGLTYTTSEDGSVVIANAAVRFSTRGLSPTADMIVTVETTSGKTVQFQFRIKDLR